MPIEIYIAVLTASIAIVVATVLLIAAAVYLWTRVNHMAQSASAIEGGVTELIQESRGAAREVRLAASRVAASMDDVEHITQAARGWADGASRMIGAVGAIAERPVLLVSRKAITLGGIVIGVLQVLRNSKR